MPTKLYAHLTWTTLQRQPLINQTIADFLLGFLARECLRHSARLLQCGIVTDHVHIVLELGSTLNIPRLVQGLKGASARIANRDGLSERAPLRWAEGYDLRSVSVHQLQSVIEYVRGQSARHPDRAIKSVLQDAKPPSRDFSP